MSIPLEAWLEQLKQYMETTEFTPGISYEHEAKTWQAIKVIEKLKEVLEVYTCGHCNSIGNAEQCYEYQSCRALAIDPEKL